MDDTPRDMPSFFPLCLCLSAVGGGLLMAAPLTPAEPVRMAPPDTRVEAPVALRVSEGLENPLGFHDATPTFSWKLPVGVTAQTRYRVVVASDSARLTSAPDLWDSGVVESDRSVHVPYEGAGLTSRQKVFWAVRYWDPAGHSSGWSETAQFELGLLTGADWQASWIGFDRRGEPLPPLARAEILEATYGDHAEAGSRIIPVTDALRAAQDERGQVRLKIDSAWAGEDPAPGARKVLRVRCNVDGKERSIEKPEGGTLVLPPMPLEGGIEPVYHLRREFAVDAPVRWARLYVTARGLFEVSLNGRKVGHDVFTPGWTAYHKRIETLTYDVTEHLREGGNAIGAMLAEGWYSGHLIEGENHYGDAASLLVQLEWEDADGTRGRLVSDEGWKASDQGPIREASIYHGEVYEAAREMPGWNKAGFDDAGWRRVSTAAIDPNVRLTPKRFAPVRVMQTLTPKTVSEPEPGRFVFDLGQNMVGWPELTVPVKAGQVITVRVAELLHKDGTLYTDNYRAARSRNTYTAAADGVITWKPTFTFQGFQYVELSGFSEGVTPDPSWVKGRVLHTDFEQIGTFTSSHAKLNQLQRNIQWGQRGNFLDIPTDCPQRDERLGWTGDAQIFAATAMFNFDTHAFFASWLESMRDDQRADGAIPPVVPQVLGWGESPAWGDAAIVVPWRLYVRTGDLDVLRDNIDMMRRWIGWYRNKAEDNRIREIGGFGDWLQPFATQNRGDTEQALIANAYYAHGARTVAVALERLGRPQEAEAYAAEEKAVERAFAAHYLGPDGALRNTTETQTAYLLALQYGLVPEAMREQTTGHLVRLIEEADYHLRTGFVGTPYINRVLTKVGHPDLAAKLLFQETYPSWFYSINQGATTLWERWNSYSHEDGFGDAGMNSFNHYAYGAVGQWMYERLAGLKADIAAPGYKHFRVLPLIEGPLTSARAELETPYGRAVSGWTRQGNEVEMEVVIPPNTTATVTFPDGRPPETLAAGTYRFKVLVPADATQEAMKQ